MSSRSFHLGDVLSVTTGRLVSARHMEGVYDILNYMTGDSLFTHQLPRAAEACRPALLSQHPGLADVLAELVPGETWGQWVDRMAATHGSHLAVTPLAAGGYVARDPLQELVEMAGSEKVVVVGAADGR